MEILSVLMPVFNGESYLMDAIDSILAQGFPHFKFIIINDGSTDKSAEIIRGYQDSRIRYYENSTNLGLSRSLNYGLSLIDSPYIARMDADDISHPRRFASQVEFLKKNPQVGVLGTAVQVIDHLGRVKNVRRFPERHPVLTWSLGLFNPIVHPSVMMRSEVLVKVGGYQDDFRTAQDHDLWRRASHVSELANLPDVLLKHRRHRQNVSSLQPSEHRRNSVKTIWRALTDQSAVDIDEALADCLIKGDCVSRRGVNSTAEILYQHLQRGLSNQTLLQLERAFMKRVTAERLIRLGTNRCEGRRSWNIVFRAFKIDPWIAIRLLNKRLQRLLLRFVSQWRNFW